jgi:ABC-2 type transport system ATP-binding protein
MTGIIDIHGFHKTFFLGLRRRRFEAAIDISFHVEPGEIFGFLGPNGAGKTTTIKALLGLIRPDGGHLRLCGHDARSMAWKSQVGYLPEHPNFYGYLTGFELVTWFGQLSGYSRQEAETQAHKNLARVKLTGAMHRRLRSYSKGMLQRAGLAQAMLGNPKLLILDEPMTGLDPIGRKDIRELLLELRHEGSTVFYSTHILPDVEVTCDRVGIVHRGRMQRSGRLDEILSDTAKSVSVRLRQVPATRMAQLATRGRLYKKGDDWIELSLPDIASARAVVAEETAVGAFLEAFTPEREDLESLFVRTLGVQSAVEEAPQ